VTAQVAATFELHQIRQFRQRRLLETAMILGWARNIGAVPLTSQVQPWQRLGSQPIIDMGRNGLPWRSWASGLDDLIQRCERLHVIVRIIRTGWIGCQTAARNYYVSSGRRQDERIDVDSYAVGVSR
jgi:hypothetical protein